jgi:hypothetical protein
MHWPEQCSSTGWANCASHIGKPATPCQRLKSARGRKRRLERGFYLKRGLFKPLRNRGQIIPEALLVHLTPLKWEHINFDRRLSLAP